MKIFASHATSHRPSHFPRSARVPRLAPRPQIQHGMLRAHMRESERRAWPRPLIKHGTLRARRRRARLRQLHGGERQRRAKRCTHHVQCSLNCLCASLSLAQQARRRRRRRRRRLRSEEHPAEPRGGRLAVATRRVAGPGRGRPRRRDRAHGSRRARKREVARTWPTRKRRARARLLRTARAREVARIWPSYEMVRDTAQSFTRRYEMVRGTVIVH